MTDRAAHAALLVHVLADIEFGKRYYSFYEQTRKRAPMARQNIADIQAVMASVPLEFKFDRRESLFEHNEQHNGLEIGLNVVFPHSTVELVLNLKTRHGHVGGPFTLLARQVERLRDPSFSYVPAAPRPVFSSLDELKEAVLFAIGLFEDARQAVLSSDGWDT